LNKVNSNRVWKWRKRDKVLNWEVYTVLNNINVLIVRCILVKTKFMYIIKTKNNFWRSCF